MKKIRDLQNQTFGRLTVLRCVGRDQRGHAVWLCRCECKKEIKVGSSNLLTGNSTKCTTCGYKVGKKEQQRRVNAGRIQGRITRKRKIGIFSRSQMRQRRHNGSVGGRLGAHQRWHLERGISRRRVCKFCRRKKAA